MGKVNAVHATRTPSNEGGINTSSFKLLLQYTLKTPNSSEKQVLSNMQITTQLTCQHMKGTYAKLKYRTEMFVLAAV